MEQQWYCKTATAELGPLTPQALKKFAASGHITPDDMVRKGETSPWVPAKSVKGLWQVPKIQTPTPPIVQPRTSPAAPVNSTPKSELVVLSVIATCGAMMFLYAVYQVFFGAVIWPIKTTTYLANGFVTTVTSGSILWKLLVAGMLVLSLAMMAVCGIRLRRELSGIDVD